ncbi:MAG TPA: hypothetical protein VGM84_03665 [Steroidobacteraceae bacterium]
MLSNSPVVRSMGARTLFLLTAAMTVIILLGIRELRGSSTPISLTPIFVFLFAFDDYNAVFWMLLLLLLAVVIPVQFPARRIFRWVGEHPLGVAAICAVGLCWGALVVYLNHPLSMDEYAAYFQSRIFASGHLEGHFPTQQMDWLVPAGFQNFFVSVSHFNGAVASGYWPGFALILTPFTFLGIPWACNPCVSAATLLVVHRMALKVFEDTEAAGVAVLLTLASPVFFGLGISYYSMPSHLLANALYALLLMQPTPRKAAVAGVIGSIALVLHNPIPHLLFAIPWFVWVTTRKGGPRMLAALCAGYLPLSALLGIGWFELTNHLRAAGGQAAAAPTTTDFLSNLKTLLAAFGLPTGDVLLARFIGVVKIWLWAVPGLLVLACYGAVRGRRNNFCRLLTASALVTFLGYVFVPPDQGHGWGYRYFHSAWMTLPLLATAALYRPGRVPSEPDPAPRLFENADTKAFLGACIALTLVFGVGIRAWQMHEIMQRDLSQLPHYRGTEPRIVLVDTRFGFYGADLIQNDPFLRDHETRMLSHGPAEDAQMMARYYPSYHPVYADTGGTVWSAAPIPANRPATTAAPPQASR